MINQTVDELVCKTYITSSHMTSKKNSKTSEIKLRNGHYESELKKNITTPHPHLVGKQQADSDRKEWHLLNTPSTHNVSYINKL